MNKISNKRALITGGSKGIGLAIAESMLNEGMQVAITGRNENALVKARAYLGNPGEDRLLTFASDVRNLEGLNNVVRVINENWGGIDILIANAGIGHFAPIDKMTSEQWKDTIEINLTGVFNSVKAAVEPIKISKGYIITIASLAGTNFFANGSAYNASKFGLVGFTQAIMLDLRKYGVKVSTIMPGSVSTYFNDHTPSEADAWKIQPEDLGTMVIDLLKMHPRTLPSKIEVRPSVPPGS